ncbi:MAG: MBL fold metallo-hydrolase [Planctomycetaceae bacterium]
MSLESPTSSADNPFVVVLGVAQDGGVPQPGCECMHCRAAWDDARLRRHPACLGIVDPLTREYWMFDCTPSFGWQLRELRKAAASPPAQLVSGIFVSHAHLGHYTGLALLGREAMAANEVPVYAMPRMAGVLRDNEPWRQLVQNRHLTLSPLEAGRPLTLNQRIRVLPFLVPHREELSETIGLEIVGPARSVGWLTDIDTWEAWDVKLEDWIGRHDVVFIDGTFFDGSELPDRERSRIPHPTIRATVERLSDQAPTLKNRVHFVHLNHSNPVLRPGSQQAQWLADSGCQLAEEGQRESI